METQPFITIYLNDIEEGLTLNIDARKAGTLFDASESAQEHNEARFQLLEGCFYDYELSSSDYCLKDPYDKIVIPRARQKYLGTLAPNIYVGTLELPILHTETDEIKGYIQLEVQSIKAGYREDYRDMLELITEKCTDLLMQANAPVSHNFDIDYNQDYQTLYQRFAFIKSIISSDEFLEAVHRIVTMPVTTWADKTESKDIRSARRLTNTNIKELLKSGNRTAVPKNHYLNNYGIDTLAERINSIRKIDSVDTPENRFIKYALESFLKFCSDMHQKATALGFEKLERESEVLIKELENQLHHSIFKDISRPTTLKLNSPVLQRKEGYREVLRVWLMFDLAAKLVWQGGEDVYGAGKKDIATLYEYWLFFKLLDLFQELFEIDAKNLADLIQPTSDGLSLQIKQGKFTSLEGCYDPGSRKLHVRFNYNRSFSGRKPYPHAGSWTTTLRPDYTLSFWPFGISEPEAERQEVIVHVHFDAKYKVANLGDYIKDASDDELSDEKKENRKGNYKNADLLKMHAYKDAIRRTGGAYVLYPGDKDTIQKGFHEIIPGLGAFPLRPSKTDTGVTELKAFILELINHFVNRTSQREKLAFRTYDIHENPPNEANELRESLPENYNSSRHLIPDDTFVLVGYYNSQEHYDWFIKHHCYNFRMESGSGSLELTSETVSAKYLLLHTKGDANSGKLWRITGKGPKVWSKDTMMKKNYPNPDPKDYYLVIRIEPVPESDFKDFKWDFKALSNYSSHRQSGVPFTCSLSELMRKKIN